MNKGVTARADTPRAHPSTRRHPPSTNSHRARLKEAGITLTELLVGIVMSVALIGVVSRDFLTAERTSLDQRIRNRTQDEARAIFDMIAYDFRAIGSGTALGQTNFTATLVGDPAPYPVLPGATATNIRYRLNERGNTTVLTANFTPSFATLTFNALNTSFLQVKDSVYISDVTVGGDNGFQGQVAALSPTSVTLEVWMVPPSGITLAAGSLVSNVSTIELAQSTNDGVTRERIVPSGHSEYGNKSFLSPRSTMTLTYLGRTGNTLAIPLSASDIELNLSSIRLNVSVESEVFLSTGSKYTAQISEPIALRNLILNRN